MESSFQLMIAYDIATSLQDCRNSKFVIFQEKHLKVYKSHKLNRITHLELNRILVVKYVHLTRL